MTSTKILSFQEQTTPFTLKNNFQIMLGLKPEKFKNIEAPKKARYSCKYVLIFKHPQKDLINKQTEFISQWMKNEQLIGTYLEYQNEKVLPVCNQTIKFQAVGY